MSLKPSVYNYFVPYGKNKYLLFNAHSNALALVDEEMKEAFEHFDENVLSSLPEDDLEIMKERMFLMDDKTDEIYRIRFRYFWHIVNNYNNLVELTFIMTYACNLACTYCYEKDIKNTKSMGKDTIDRIKKYIKNQAIKENARKIINAVFYGGEPLLNWKGCKSIIEFLRELHSSYETPYETRLITNGLLLTDEIFQEFLDNNIAHLQITLDGDKEKHDQRRKTKNGKGTYDTILDRITKVYETDPNLLGVRINIDDTNYHSLPALFDDLTERGLDNLSLNFGIVYHSTKGCKTGDSSCLDLRNMEEVLPQLWRLARSKGFVIKTRPAATSVYCMFDLPYAFVIDPFGDFYNCYNLVGMKDFCIGSLDNGGKLTLNYNFYDQLSRDPTRFEECSTCTLLPVCMGGCAFFGYNLNGTFHSAGCGEYKKIIGDRLKWYAERQYAHILEESEKNESI